MFKVTSLKLLMFGLQFRINFGHVHLVVEGDQVGLVIDVQHGGLDVLDVLALELINYVTRQTVCRQKSFCIPEVTPKHLVKSAKYKNGLKSIFNYLVVCYI
jgi:hypothetical protein